MPYSPSNDIDCAVGGDACTNMRSKTKKLENKLIPEKDNKNNSITGAGDVVDNVGHTYYFEI